MRLGTVHQGCDIRGPLVNSSDGKSLGERLLGFTGRARTGPENVTMVAHPAIARWRQDGGYRPGTLAGIERDLGIFDIAGIEDYSSVTVV